MQYDLVSNYEVLTKSFEVVLSLHGHLSNEIEIEWIIEIAIGSEESRHN